MKPRIYDKVCLVGILLTIVVVKRIREDPVKFDAATLGRSVDEYCAWITRNKRSSLVANRLTSSWGGEIELAVLSEYFEVGIGCVDVKTGHVYNYGTSLSHHVLIHRRILSHPLHFDILGHTLRRSRLHIHPIYTRS